MWQEEVWWPCVGTTDCMGQLVLKVSVSVWAVLTVCMYGTTCSIRKSCIVCQYYKCLFDKYPQCEPGQLVFQYLH